jgi:hypothetical protein
VGFEVDVAKVRDVAAKVERSAGAAGEVFRVAGGQLSVKAGGGAGWATTTTAGSTASAWEAFGPQLQSMVTALAADLRSSADEFEAAEDASMQAFAGRRFQ